MRRTAAIGANHFGNEPGLITAVANFALQEGALTLR